MKNGDAVDSEWFWLVILFSMKSIKKQQEIWPSQKRVTVKSEGSHMKNSYVLEKSTTVFHFER